jgi:hypothetical protein
MRHFYDIDFLEKEKLFDERSRNKQRCETMLNAQWQKHKKKLLHI